MSFYYDMEYVVGFLFNEDKTKILLIKKTKPDWQKGKFNGIGGKIEPHETPLEAIIRETEEESGLIVKDWIDFCAIDGFDGAGDFVVHFFAGITDIHKAIDKTEEKLYIELVNNLSVCPTVDNLQWLIPMALNSFKNNEYLKITEKVRSTT